MKSLRLYIIAVATLITLYLVAQYNRPKPVNWQRSFNTEDKIPFGTYLLNQRMPDLFPGARIDVYRAPVYNVLTDYGIEKADYIIIAPDVDLNEDDYSKLRKFIAAGNDVFISAARFGQTIQDSLKTAGSYFTVDDDGLRFKSKHLDTAHIYRIEQETQQFTFDKIDTARANVLGINGAADPNFIKYKIGKGNLYLHTAPDMFTNVALLDKEGAAYAATALSYLRKTNRVIVDQYFARGAEDEGTSLRVLLRSPAMRWALYISVAGLVIFVVYDIKRRQRIIPIVEPPKNDTLNFVNVVGRVYYEQHDNANIALKKINYFADYVRSQLLLKPDLTDPTFPENLARKSGATKGDVDELLGFIGYIGNQQKVSDGELMKLNTLIDNFYAQTK